MKKIIAFIAAVASFGYLVLETLTIADIPFVGNMDEAGATVILLTALRYFGYDVTSFLKRKDK